MIFLDHKNNFQKDFQKIFKTVSKKNSEKTIELEIIVILSIVSLHKLHLQPFCTLKNTLNTQK